MNSLFESIHDDDLDIGLVKAVVDFEKQIIKLGEETTRLFFLSTLKIKHEKLSENFLSYLDTKYTLEAAIQHKKAWIKNLNDINNIIFLLDTYIRRAKKLKEQQEFNL